MASFLRVALFGLVLCLVAAAVSASALTLDDRLRGRISKPDPVTAGEETESSSIAMCGVGCALDDHCGGACPNCVAVEGAPGRSFCRPPGDPSSASSSSSEARLRGRISKPDRVTAGDDLKASSSSNLDLCDRRCGSDRDCGGACPACVYIQGCGESLCRPSGSASGAGVGNA